VSGSFPIFDTAVEQFVAWLQPARALDVGAGSGKYAHVLRNAAPACERVAIEVEASYVERFGLRDLYHRVDLADATRWWRDEPEEAFDLVIVGDCIEHLAKSDGLDLLNAMVYRSAWVLVLAPEFIVQGVVDGVAAEVHRSVWSERDLYWHDLWAWDNTRAISLFALRGYRPSPLSIDDLMQRVNDGAVMLKDFDGQGLVRPWRLRMVDLPREVAYRPR
jgi:hypothetical protein